MARRSPQRLLSWLVVMAVLFGVACTDGGGGDAPGGRPPADGASGRSEAQDPDGGPDDRPGRDDESEGSGDGGGDVDQIALETRELEAVARGLPRDPATAAMELVQVIHGDDRREAVAATAELLRRSGIPVVDGSGPVIGLPDEVVLEDAAVYAEFLPGLTDAVRAGDSYTPQQLALLLDGVRVTDGAMPVDTLVAGLGQWGKAPGLRAPARAAGAAVRALAGRRSEVLYAGADMGAIEFDPLQTLLIVAHAASRAVPRRGGGRDGGVAAAAVSDVQPVARTAAAAQDDPCRELAQAMKPKDGLEQAELDYYKRVLKEEWKRFLFKEATRRKVDFAGDTYDMAASTISVILLLVGARLELEVDKRKTHFKHAAGGRAEHVNVKATAIFSSSLAQDRLGCYSLAGIDVPPNGPMKDFWIKWTVDQEVGRGYQGKFLATTSASSRKLIDGEVTKGDGASTIELYPPVEKKPGKGEELTGSVRVKASLDKKEFPFKAKDFFFLTGRIDATRHPQTFAIKKLFDLAMSAIKKAGLPSQSTTVSVGYHGSDIYTAKGATDVWLFFLTLPVFLDIYSCSGKPGTWKGRGGFQTWRKEFGADMLEQLAPLLGVDGRIPDGLSMINNQVRFEANDAPGATTPFPVITYNNIISGAMEFYYFPDRTDYRIVGENRRYAFPVGEVELLLGGNSFPFADLEYEVLSTPEDGRCVSENSYFENL